MKTQGITRAEVEAALARAGLEIPEREKPEIAAAAHFIEEMAARLRRKREIGAEPAHIFPPPGEPLDAAIQANLRETTTRVLASLTAREERVLRMRFGIGMNTDHTLEEVGQQFSVTRERIRQIEAKALRKLKHPSRSRKLRSFLDT